MHSQHAEVVRLCIHCRCMCMCNAISAVFYDIHTSVILSPAFLPVCSAGPGWFEPGPGPPGLGARPPAAWAIWTGQGHEPVSRLWCTQDNSSAPRIPETSGGPVWPAWRNRIPLLHGSSIACRPEVHSPAWSLSPQCSARLPVPKSAHWSYPVPPRSALGFPWARRWWTSRTWPPFPLMFALSAATMTKTPSFISFTVLAGSTSFALIHLKQV